MRPFVKPKRLANWFWFSSSIKLNLFLGLGFFCQKTLFFSLKFRQNFFYNQRKGEALRATGDFRGGEPRDAHIAHRQVQIK